MIFWGIDPGVNGGIALIDEKGTVLLARKMPESDAAVWHTFQPELPLAAVRDSLAGRQQAIIEHVHASPQMGVVSAFTFGYGYGRLCIACSMLGIPLARISPRVWQKALDCLTGGDKSITKTLAIKLFPSVKVTHAIADALLLAEYGRRLYIEHHERMKHVEEAQRQTEESLEGTRQDPRQARSRRRA